jgi:hypothetical protein
MALLSELEALRDVLRDSIDDAPAYSRAPLAREYRAVVNQIAELSTGAADEKPKETGLSDFERRLRERESGSKTSRRAQTG